MRRLALVFAFCSFVPFWTTAQTSNIAPRITAVLDETKLTVLRGNTHPLARAEYDRGPAPDGLPMESMLLVLKRSTEQEAALEKLTADQQDPRSLSYHKWLTPAEFGQEFGPADRDVQTITSWLESHGFQIGGLSTGGAVIEFSGAAAQVREAFHTTIHEYVVNGKAHWANSSDPSIPSALAPVVSGVRSLHNFYPQAMHRVNARSPRSDAAASAMPQFTFPAGCTSSGATECSFGIGPTDFATIYSVIPLWNSGIDGTGITIAVVSDSNINTQDIADFRSAFGLPAKLPTVIVPTSIPGCTNPGLQPNGDEIEADLDVEWSGAIARNANIDLVTCGSTNSTFGGDLAAEYIVDSPNSTHTNTSTGLAPILSESYGDCELQLTTSGNIFYNNEWQQAAAEGITVIVSTGDNGSAGCDVDEVSGPPTQPAQFGLQVNGLASTPYNVAVGGTDFNDLNNPFLYWNTAANNAATTEASALSYIPETTWNDTCTNAVVYAHFNFSNAADACNSTTVGKDGFVLPVGGSGGISACTISTGANPSACSGGYAKPSWQMGGIITPNDSKRDIPDISLFAGDGTIAGSFYIVCERDFPKTTGAACSVGSPSNNFLEVGGTSASAQVFAGMMALVLQKSGESQGNANTVLYPLSSGNSASSIYNAVTTGTNAMPCGVNTPNCVVPSGCATSAVVVGPPSRPPGAGMPGTGILGALFCTFFFGVLVLASYDPKRRWLSVSVLVFALFVAGAGCGSSGNSSGGGSGVTPPPTSDCTVGVLSGYTAGSGYSLATGLGSLNGAALVNATNLVNPSGWPTSTNGSDFSLSLSSSNVSIANPGASNNTTLTINAAGGFNGSITLSCSDLPAGASCGFTQNPVSGAGSPVVTISTTSGTPAGTYFILITAQTTSGTIIQRSVAVTVTVV